MCPQEPEFDDHRISAVAQRDDFVVLIRKRNAGVVIVAPHVGVAVVDGERRDDLVVRMREGGQHVVPVLTHFVMEVVEHEFFASLQHIDGRDGEAVGHGSSNNLFPHRGINGR